MRKGLIVMAKVKGMKKLCKAVSAQLKPFGISKAVLSTEYSYVFADGSVTFKITEGSIEDEWFNEFIEERFGYHVENTFIISLLHEIGHHFTMGKFNKFQQSKERVAIAKIEHNLSESNDEDFDKEMYKKYFDLPMEKSATKWAVNYYRTHRQAINRFYKKLEKELQKFYKLNGLYS